MAIVGVYSERLDIPDLPLVLQPLRSGVLFARVRAVVLKAEDQARQRVLPANDDKASPKWWWRHEGGGWPLLISLIKLNGTAFGTLFVLTLTWSGKVLRPRIVPPGPRSVPSA